MRRWRLAAAFWVAAAPCQTETESPSSPSEVRLDFKTPRNGTRVLPLVEPEVDLWVDDHMAFVLAHGDTARMCCTLDAVALWCEHLDATKLVLPKRLDVGVHTLTCSLVDSETGDSLLRIELKRRNDALAEPLIAWWRGDEGAPLPPATAAAARNSIPWVLGGAVRAPLVAVGVKCAATAVVARDAMRRTWLSDGPPDGALQARFIIGAVEDPVLRAALFRENATFGDLLLAPDFPVRDSYHTLVDKTKGFMAFVRGKMPGATFVMMTDDDILVDVVNFLQALRSDDVPKERFYAGQEHFGRPKLPQRDPNHRNYLPVDAYPMSQLPPFAIGPHYFMSGDCARFIAKNAEDLRGVHPIHSEQFVNGRLLGCRPDAVSTADLTPAGIFAMHANWRSGRDPCAGYDELEWVKQPRFKFKWVDQS